MISLPVRAADLTDVRPGSRAMGMGMAYTALADDLYGMYYNPAGLAGSDFTQTGGTFGRMISPDGLVAFESFAYSRPLPILPGATVGAGFFGAKQGGDVHGEKHELLGHFSHSVRLPQFYLKRPLQYGGNFKFQQGTRGRGIPSSLAMGFDLGVLFDSGRDWTAGLAATDVTTNNGFPGATLNMSGAYRWRKQVSLAGDLRLRTDVTQFFPGVEIDFFQRLLKVRLGKGLPLDGVTQFAFGIGANFSPVILDVAMGIPFSGINREGGSYQLSLAYKFGAPQFYGRFVGSAAREAEDLRSEILELESKKKDIGKQIQEMSIKGDTTSQELDRKLAECAEHEQKRRECEFRVQDEQYESAHPKAKPEPPPPSATKPPKPRREPDGEGPRRLGFPQRYKVLPGDTLRSLAEKFYGDPSLWEILYDENPDKVERGLPIVGEVLVIPAPKKR